MTDTRTLLAMGCLATVSAMSMPSSLQAQIDRLDPRFDALIPPDAVIEVLADGLEWAEGPVWDAADDALLVSDVPRNVVLRWKEGEGLREFLSPSGYTGEEPFTGPEPGSNGLIFDAQGRLLLCQHGDRRVVRREPDGSITVIADRYDGKRFNSPNDLVFGPNGDLYFTDPPYGLPGRFDSPEKELDFQGVYRVSSDGTVSLLTTELEAPNGIGFSPDGSTLYVSSSGSDHGWMAFPVLEDGSIGEGHRFAEVTSDDPGEPDGLVIDVDGNLFATGPGGVHVFAPDGTRLGRIVTGVPTGNVAWGDDGTVLYIAANHRILRVRTTTRGFLGFQH